MNILDRHDFVVDFYQKDKLIKQDIFGFICDDFEYRMKELECEIQKQIEQIVITKGWLTTYYGVFAIVKPYRHLRSVAMMIIYKPTLQFYSITSIDQMKDELQIIGSSIQI